MSANEESKPKIKFKVINRDEHRAPLDLMEYIDDDDKTMLNLSRIKNMSKIDWGKTMAIPNQYIQKELLQTVLGNSYEVYTTDDIDLPKEITTANNSPGFDIIIKMPNGSYKRLQSKLRQVTGVTDVSQQTHFETTRRNSKKNENKNSTGHVAYSTDEFDFVFISLINVKNSFERRNNCNLWTFVLINVNELINEEHDCCETKIQSEILRKNIIDVNNSETITNILNS